MTDDEYYELAELMMMKEWKKRNLPEAVAEKIVKETISSIRAKEENKRMFSYIGTSFRIPDKKVKGIVFDISRYGKHKHRIDFDELIPIDEAICKVERFLSTPLDDEYYEKIKDDLFYDERDYFDSRGDCLGDLKFLEQLREIEPNVVKIVCGS